MLTGKYKVNQAADPASRGGRHDRRMMETEWRPESMLIAEKLKAHADAAGVSLVHWAVASGLNNHRGELHHRGTTHLRTVDELLRRARLRLDNARRGPGRSPGS